MLKKWKVAATKTHYLIECELLQYFEWGKLFLDVSYILQLKSASVNYPSKVAMY